MARLDTTLIWFQRGEDAAAMAETPLANGSEPRRVPTMVWVAAGVALTAAIFGGVILHMTHAARVVDAPPAIPPAAPATAPAAAPATHPAAPAALPPAPPVKTSDHTSDGERLLRQGKPAAALAAFQETLAQHPNDVPALRGACVALGKLGRVNDGARVCRHALDRQPDDVETRRALATLYYNGGAYKWSATEWRRVLQHSPHDARARRALRNAEARARG